MGHRYVNSSTTTTSARGLGHDRLHQVRSVLLGLTLFIGMVIWVAFSLGLLPQGTHLVGKLRVVGVMTWLYALAQIIDLKVWRSQFATRRRAASRIPEAVEGWLFGQMFAWFGIVYYGLTGDAGWYVAGLVLFFLSVLIFPIADDR